MIQRTETVQIVHCPTCGHLAKRQLLRQRGVVKTECDRCDYLLVTRAETAQVVEAHVPGFPVLR